MAVKTKFVNNAPKVRAELEHKEVEIMNEWGKLWQSIASKLITQSGAVDTGRLRASLSYITYKGSGKHLASVNETQNKDYLNGKTSSRNELIVGSNVEYAKYIEISSKGRPARPFVLPAIVKYKKQYQALAEQILKSGK